MKISIIFFSKTGYTAETAEQIATACARKASSMYVCLTLPTER